MVGGVAANRRLRAMMKKACEVKSIHISLAPMEFCTDNAAMIGAAALMRLELDQVQSSIELGVSARLPLKEAACIYSQKPPF